ncbi:MAG: PAS domain-containing protein, partial [Methanomicrobiales archaeon]|nr:PAS domain-containing protein [Methanomicrobiales archaeon]
MKRNIRWWLVIAVCILIAGVVLTIWSAQQQDRSMRNDLLIKTNIAKTGISGEHLEVLNGSAADFVTPEYQALKSQLGKIRASDQDIRFAYVMGQRRDGTIIIYSDSEPPESENYSPPGEIYSEASTVLKTIFSTREKATEGPLSDRWGTWVSGFIPITDPATGRVIAVFGLDVDAKDWNFAIFGACLPTVIATLLIVLLILVSVMFQRRNEVEQRRLETSEEKFSRVFHANPALLLVSSIEDGRILDVNASFLATLGYCPEDVIGRTTLEMGLYVDPADRNTILRMVKETGQVRNMAVKLYRKDRAL